MPLKTVTGMSNFNPRSHEGSDSDPVQGSPEQGNFNPRSHEGSDGTSLIAVAGAFVFQSTLPRGERPLAKT